MKRIIHSAILLFAATIAFASDGFTVKYTQPNAGVQQLVFSLGDYHIGDVALQGETYSRIGFEGKIVTKKKGFAEVPYLNATVMINPVRNVNIEIVPGEYEEILLDHPLVPSRGVIYRTQDPASVPYEIDPRSVTDSWYPVDLAEKTDPFILRDIRGTSVYVYPFQYNAALQVLRVYKTVTVRLVENNTPSINRLTKDPRKIVREMDAVYNSVFINYSELNREDLTIAEFGDIYVVVTARDEDAIQPYVDWKREKGYNVTVEVVPTGTVVNSYVQNAYDNNNNILYVLLVGDWEDLQCEVNGSGRPMDPQVGTVVGDDDFADISVGRFSANSPSDVTTQVNKVINYEKTPELGADWYATATGIGSDQGQGIGDDGEIDYQHESVIYHDKLNQLTYTTFDSIFDPWATAEMVTSAVNTGTSVINYTGHGSSGSWGTSGFNTTNVAALTNGDRLPFIISVACDNGDFDLGTCFAEAWLRKSGGGAVMFLGASISQPWQEPMRGQDYFMDVLIGGYDYDAHPGQDGISTSEQRTTIGSIVFNGLTLMCTESGGSADWETAETWNIFGDPSMQVRTATPAELTLTNTQVMVGVPFTTNVTSGNGPVENAMVTLSQDGNYYTGITDAAGNVTIEQELAPGTAKLVVTGFNTETVYENVNVVPPDGPYVTITAVEVDDSSGNANGVLDYGETVHLTISLSNVGSTDATDVMAEISSSDEFISISGDSASYGTIPAGETVTVTDGFEISALENIPDMHVALFGLDASDGASRETWSSTFAIPGHAPVLEMAEYTIIDTAGGNGNGRFDPGETVTLVIMAHNDGSADAMNVEGNLTTESPYITINNTPLTYGNITAGESAEQSYELSIDATTPTGQSAQFMFSMAGDMNIVGFDDFTEYVGQIPVLVLDWDGNHNSADVAVQCLNDLQVGYDMMDAFPPDRNLYSSIFVFLGTYNQNHVLTESEGQVLADYLDQGGNLYMEGADTWYYDQQYTPTPVHPMFNIAGTDDGSNDLGTLAGQDSTFTGGMTFVYDGDNSYVDHISAIAPAQMIFRNTSPSYGAAVAYDAGSYRTIGSSFEFGGLVDGDKTKDDLMVKYLDFFHIAGIWTQVEENVPSPALPSGCYPNPFRDQTVIVFESRTDSPVNIDIYSLEGKLVKHLTDEGTAIGRHEIIWNGTDDAGSRITAGMYFYRIVCGDDVSSGKLMLAE